jgi:DMSO/TMAO reductase YedYZ molybdopterin-dependent catalytic subunit
MARVTDAPQIPGMTRRRFVQIAGTAATIASTPMILRVMRADAATPPAKFGGPTPNSDFYVTSYSSTPAVDASSWRLRISGLVKEPLTLTYDDIKRLPSIDETLTLECISNPPDGTAISNANWVGTKLRPLLDRAGVSGNAVYAAMRAADGFYTGVPLDEIMRKENFLAYQMNGEPLPQAHGFPLRIMIPGKYGMKQPKWITEIQLMDREFTGYWEARGWSNSAWRKVNSGFFSPRPTSRFFLSRSTSVKPPVDIYGWALAGPAGIRSVDVSIDDGATWNPAELVRNASQYVWTVWKYRFAPAKPGDYRLRVRATSGDSVMQPRTDPQTGSGMSGQSVQDLSFS